MPRIGASKEALEGLPPVPDGQYEIRLETFEPKTASKGGSVNLNPVLKIVNHPTAAGRRIYDNLNTTAGWILEAFSHGFGVPMEVRPDGGADLAGDFMGNDDDPTSWNYVGPLTGAVAKVFVKTVDNTRGKMVNKVDQWICQVPGCTIKHASGLAK